MIHLKPGQAPEIVAPLTAAEARQLSELATSAARLALDTSTHLLQVADVLVKALAALERAQKS